MQKTDMMKRQPVITRRIVSMIRLKLTLLIGTEDMTGEAGSMTENEM